MSLISFENVSFSYVTEDDNGNEIRREVLKNFNLNIEQGSFVAILGLSLIHISEPTRPY